MNHTIIKFYCRQNKNNLLKIIKLLGRIKANNYNTTEGTIGRVNLVRQIN